MNASDAIFCHSCGKQLDDQAKAQTFLDSAMRCIGKEDYTGAISAADEGLRETQALNAELEGLRKQSLDLIDSMRDTIKDGFSKTREALTKRHFPSARKHLEEIQPFISRARGTADLRPDYEDLRHKADAMANRFAEKLSEANTLASEAQLRQAAEIVSELANLFPWDETLITRLTSLNEGLAKVDSFAAETKHVLSQKDFDKAFELIQEIRAIEPDHPQLQSVLAEAEQMKHYFDSSLQAAWAQVDRLEYDDAVQAFSDLADEFPLHPEVREEGEKLATRRDAFTLLTEVKKRHASGKPLGRPLTRAYKAWRAIDQGPEGDKKSNKIFLTLEGYVQKRKRKKQKRILMVFVTIVVIAGLGAAGFWFYTHNQTLIENAEAQVASGQFEEAEASLAGILLPMPERKQIVRDAIELGRIQPVIDQANAVRDEAIRFEAEELALRTYLWAENTYQAAQDEVNNQQWSSAVENFELSMPIFEAAISEAKAEAYYTARILVMPAELKEQIDQLRKQAEVSKDLSIKVENYNRATRLLEQLPGPLPFPEPEPEPEPDSEAETEPVGEDSPAEPEETIQIETSPNASPEAPDLDASDLES